MTRMLTVALTSCAVIVASGGAVAARGHHGGSGYTSPVVPTHGSPILNGNIPRLPSHGSPPLSGPTRSNTIVRNHIHNCDQIVDRGARASCYGNARRYSYEGGLGFGETPARSSGWLPQGGQVRDHRH
jgi:hypothetical protein